MSDRTVEANKLPLKTSMSDTDSLLLIDSAGQGVHVNPLFCEIPSLEILV